MKKTLLIIGAGGFIGGFIAEEALRRGYDTYVGVRASTSRRYLQNPALHFVVFDYDNPESVAETIRSSRPESGRWDYIIWNLGATKCSNFSDFNKINFCYLRDFTEVLIKEQCLPERFLFMSSLSAVGPADEKDYSPITSRTIPNPNTRYGLSKIKAETYLETKPEIPWIIFRPTGVYGPHEQDYLMMIKSIDSHFDFGVGFRRQMLTFIYVEDLVNAMFDAIAAPAAVNRRYIISEDRAYTQREFRRIVSEELGGRFVIPLRLPMWIVYLASVAAEKLGVLRGKPSTLNRDKFKIMRQRNWSCDIAPAQRDFNFTPRFPLREGVRATVKSYLEEKARARAQKKGKESHR